MENEMENKMQIEMMTDPMFQLFSFNGNMKAYNFSKFLADPLTDPEYFIQQYFKTEPLLKVINSNEPFMMFGESTSNFEFIRFLMSEVDWVVDSGNGWVEILDSDGKINRFEQIIK